MVKRRRSTFRRKLPQNQLCYGSGMLHIGRRPVSALDELLRPDELQKPWPGKQGHSYHKRIALQRRLH